MSMEDMKLCIDWLFRTDIISGDHRLVSIEAAELLDFADLLRDGVLLCELANKLMPKAIDPKDYCHKPQMSKCACVKNIRAFLHACRNSFAIREADLFDPNDLYDMNHIPKVIHTLSLLSQSTCCYVLGIQPFYASSKKIAMLSDVTLNNFRNHHPNSNNNNNDLHFSCNKERIEGDVYGRLVDFQPAAIVRDPLPCSKRELCIRELAVTERNFIDALHMIREYFMKPLKDILQPHHYRTIFLCIERLHAIHSGFQADLSVACANSCSAGGFFPAAAAAGSLFTTASSAAAAAASSTSSPVTVAGSAVVNNHLTIPDCFITWKERFLVYGEYCSNLLEAQNLLDELCTSDPEVQKKVEESQLAANEGRFKLRDLLSLPMQRILKYHLFLKELIKNTERTHVERKSLERALEEIQDLSLYVNEVKRDNEALLLLEEIEQSISGYQMPENMSLRDYGRLLNDGELKLKAHSDHKTKNRYAFLFDKVLLLCKPKGENYYSFKDAFAVSSFKVEDVAYKEKERNFGFTFILGEASRENAYTVGCKTMELRNNWIKSIRLAQENFSPPFAHSPLHDFEMATFHEATICDVCRKLLRGVFYQGYRCAKTGMIVHKECIEKAKDMSGPPILPPKPVTLRTNSSTNASQIEKLTKGKVKVLCSYFGIPMPPNEKNPLKIEADSIIDLINDDDVKWWMGRCEGREGYFPKECVTIISLNNSSSSNHNNDFSRHSTINSSTTAPTSTTTTKPHQYDNQPQLPQHSSSTPLHPPPPPPFPPHNFAHPPNHRMVRPNNNININNEVVDGDCCVIGVNSSLFEQYPWFAGSMSRDEASRKLEKFQDGTFLVRLSQSDSRRGEFALSIKYGIGHPVKHIKIQRSYDSLYYIADCKMFKSIPELVKYYQQNSLQPSFSEVPTTLQFPFKEVTPIWIGDAHIIGYCQANYDYTATEACQLSLKQGDLVAILSKVGGARGWWKGRLNGKVGYFPSGFVVESDEDGNVITFVN